MSIERINAIIQSEADRQAATLSLIASENYVSKAVLDASGSVFTNKYAEGYPGKRYYGGTEQADQLESYVQDLARELFRTDYAVNVQPYSGTPANLAVYQALLKRGDTIVSMDLGHGGHLSHGHHLSLPGQLYKIVSYGVQEDGLIDYGQVERLVAEHRPRLLIAGGSAYPAHINFAEFSRIANINQAILLVDMAHIAGLVAGGAHPSPFGFADVVTTTTHKTLRGPRGGLIFSRPELAAAIDRAVFPGVQGGPHLQTMAAQGVALSEALSPQFARYAKQVVLNAQALAYRLQFLGWKLITDGTDTHLILVDVAQRGIGGKAAQNALEQVGISANMNLIPFDRRTPLDPSGLRLGTPAATSRGMKEAEMERLAGIIDEALTDANSWSRLRGEVAALTKRFRIPLHY